MNKIICSIAIIAGLGISSSSYAQKLMLGPRVGMNNATVAWDSATPYGFNKGTIIGLIGGAQLDVWFSDMVALSTGVLLVQKGWHAQFDFRGVGTASSDFTLNYFEVPLLLKVGLSTGGVQPYVFAGPSLGYMFWAYGQTFKINQVINAVDFSIVGGAGVAVNLPSGTQIFLEGGYAFGLVNTVNENDPNYGDQLSPGLSAMPPVGAFRSRDIRIAGGVLFPI